MSDVQPEICNCLALRQATRHATAIYDRALAPVGLGINQYSILSRLNRVGPTTNQDLASMLVMDRSTLGHLLRPLESRGLVVIGTSKTDRRSRAIVLSEEGRRLLSRARRLWNVAQQRFEATFGTEKAVDLRIVLKQVATLNIDGVEDSI